MDQQGIRHGFPHRHARIEAGQRILEHHLQATAGPGQLAPPIRSRSRPPGARGRPHRGQAHQGAAEGALAAARSTHHPEGFARPQAQAHPIDGLEPALPPGR